MKNRLDRIEQEILKILPDQAEDAWFSEVCRPAEHSIDLSMVNRFCEPGRNLIRRGGKRWRPLLMVLTAEAFGGERGAEFAYPLTPVVELPHNGSLIIDDIEDSSDMRRGEPAVHTVFGTDISINAGNLLYYLPTSCIDASDLPDERKLQLYQIYSRYLRRVHFGQGFDIAWHRDPAYIPDERSYELMCRLKTGCLAGMAAEIGVCAGKGDEKKMRTLGELAEQLGVAFQVMDDVVNLETGNPGKMRGDDIIEGKKSLPLILHAELQPHQIPKLASQLADIRERNPEDGRVKEIIEDVISAMDESGAISEARLRAEEMYRNVIDGFEGVLPENNAKQELIEMLRSLG